MIENEQRKVSARGSELLPRTDRDRLYRIRSAVIDRSERLFLKPKTYCGAAQEKESKVGLFLLVSSVLPSRQALHYCPSMAGEQHPIPRPWILDFLLPAIVILLIAAHVFALISHRQATASWPGAEKQGPLIREFACSMAGDLLLHFVVRLVFCENCIRSFAHFCRWLHVGIRQESTASLLMDLRRSLLVCLEEKEKANEREQEVDAEAEEREEGEGQERTMKRPEEEEMG
ncbi:hypothetical protein MUK42_29470 [Musa troglodytarum]|uniref:Uncharacterized protein n=1 Tax=Musa troglodytarum TaxID=320322 RepID=A0A9E7FTJ7_9LILI|nr:hypothetical protein MUK42_29470 [Musa troglodytarum]